MIIRKYAKQDREDIRKICMDTASKKYRTKPKLREMMCLMFIDYFLDNEPENCFVAEEDGKRCGYIVCSTNADLYKQKMPLYIKKIKKISLIHGIFSQISAKVSNKLKKDYDAEFHINIEPSSQGKKIGPKLLHTLAKYLLSQGKNQMFLITANRKTRGYSFYKHFGFHEAKNLFGGSLALAYENKSSLNYES